METTLKFNEVNMINTIKDAIESILVDYVAMLKLKFPEVNFDILVSRSALYGNNFPDIAKEWNKYIENTVPDKLSLKQEFIQASDDTKYIINKNGDKLLSVPDVINLMVLMKETRAKHYGETEDNKIDNINYNWIAKHYPMYETLELLISLSKKLDNICNNLEA